MSNPESEQSDHIVIGVIELTEAKRLKSALEDKGVHVQLMNNPETCKSGKNCKTTVELVALREDVSQIESFLQGEKQRLMDGLDINVEQLNQVFDPEKETALCPACGTGFSTKLTECPDCGLVFMSSENEPS